MDTQTLARAVFDELPFAPTHEQGLLVYALSAFVVGRLPGEVFMLNGYAGTGKTSVIGALVRAMRALRLRTVVLAPTGRAAKVAAHMAGMPASTVHKRLYRGNSLDPGNTKFFLAENRDTDTLFIVDEASMVTDAPEFGRSLLQQLVRHVYSAPGCGMLLLGDNAQLPPVGMDCSPAMNSGRLRQLGLTPVTFSLETPVRQTADSGILHNASTVRNFLFSDRDPSLFRLEASPFADVTVVNPSELADYLADSWGTVGTDETVIVTRSNKRANNFNRAIRNMVMYADEPLQQGDRIVISKNDYFWSRRNNLNNFMANGETACVEWVGHAEKVYGRWFVDVELSLPDVDTPVAAKIMLRSLAAEGPNIPREEMTKFYNRVMAEYEGELSHKLKGAAEDEFYNALQVKYAYCVTTHKAQGGQWRHVYIDMGAIPRDAVGPEFYRWLYTAMTRATERLFLINPTVPVD